MRRMKYIYQQKNWPKFDWDPTQFALKLAEAHQEQGRQLGRMENLGFNLRNEAILRTLTLEVTKK